MIRLALRVQRADAELVLAELLELAPSGVEEVDRGDVVEYAVYGPPGELPELPALEAAAGGALVDVRTSDVADDWPDRWRDFHRPVLVGGRLWVRPPWWPASEREGAIDLAIEPGRAFGTGAHATTRLCLELLLELEPRGPLVDLGCGSGVLAVAAAKLGYGPVLAVDHEAAALEATAANARANGVEVEARRVDLRRQPPPTAATRTGGHRGQATVTANLAGPLLRELAPRLPDPLPRRLVASGMLEAEAGAVVAAFAARGCEELARRGEGDWVALLLGPSDPGRAGHRSRR